MPETIVIKSDVERNAEWRDAFKDYDINVCFWNRVADKRLVDYALVWKPEPGSLRQFSNLKIIFSIGAGIDHLKGSDIVPPGIPVVRMVETSLTAGMVEYVCYHALRFHRFMPQYERYQREQQWRTIMPVPASARTIGILGLGVLGSAVAQALKPFGFRIAGWSRTAKRVGGVESYYGDSQLNAFLGQTDILVCLLPLTEQTRYILNAENLSKLPRGACLINAGRGRHQVQSDLIGLLDNGRLGGAALDVFEDEPLPQHDPLWSHPKISITPHVASMTTPSCGAQHVRDNITRFRLGKPLAHLANMERGY